MFRKSHISSIFFLIFYCSQVGPTARHGERKYDYPVFAGKHESRPANGRLPMPSTSNRNVNPASEDPFYQSASQIYGPASEDPYRLASLQFFFFIQLLLLSMFLSSLVSFPNLFFLESSPFFYCFGQIK